MLRSWAGESSAVIAGMLQDPASRANGQGLLARADELLAGSRADGLADESDLLPTGLTRRLASLAGALRAAVAGAPPADPDLPRIPGAALAEVERAWTRVATHRLADTDARTPAFHAAVRLARWLAGSAAASAVSLQPLLDRHGESDAWVDSAVNDAAPGVSDPDLGAGLAAVLAAVRAGAPPTTRRSPRRWPRTPATTPAWCLAPMPACGTWRISCPRWSCRWPCPPRSCCSSWTG